jgi:hypothetical protein
VVFPDPKSIKEAYKQPSVRVNALFFENKWTNNNCKESQILLGKMYKS